MWLTGAAGQQDKQGWLQCEFAYMHEIKRALKQAIAKACPQMPSIQHGQDDLAAIRTTRRQWLRRTCILL